MALLQSFGMMLICAIWLSAFAWFWTFMVIELPKDLGPYSQMSSLSMFLHRAFPMRETNDTEFEYKFDHILILAIVMLCFMLQWVPSRGDLKEAAEKKNKPAGK